MYGDIWGHRKLVSFLRDGVFYCTKGGEAMTLKKALESWKYPSILLCGIGISN